MKKIKFNHLNENEQLYNENIELIALYNQYIHEIVEFFDFLGIKNDHLLYAIVFDILNECGYFSWGNEFNIATDVFPELSIKPGISVINGIGVCRNLACFYKDIFRNFYDYPLTLCCFDKKDGEFNKDIAIYGNHMINLVFYHDAIYGFDIMNHCLFKPINKSTLKAVTIDYYLAYKEYGDLLIHLTTQLNHDDNYFLEVGLKRVLLRASAKKETIPIEEYEKIIADANNFIIERKKLFRSFLYDSQDIKEEIKQKMLLLK